MKVNVRLLSLIYFMLFIEISESEEVVIIIRGLGESARVLTIRLCVNNGRRQNIALQDRDWLMRRIAAQRVAGMCAQCASRW